MLDGSLNISILSYKVGSAVVNPHLGVGRGRLSYTAQIKLLCKQGSTHVFFFLLKYEVCISKECIGSHCCCDKLSQIVVA